nr:uncharacterized protein LOC109176714 [Ipomoea batatas]
MGSIQYPKDMTEDMLVRVKGFIIPVDFVVLDVGKDDLDVSLILGRMFLATYRAITNIGTGKLTLRIDDEEAKFDMTKIENVGKIGRKSKVKTKYSLKSEDLLWRKDWGLDPGHDPATGHSREIGLLVYIVPYLLMIET